MVGNGALAASGWPASQTTIAGLMALETTCQQRMISAWWRTRGRITLLKRLMALQTTMVAGLKVALLMQPQLLTQVPHGKRTLECRKMLNSPGLHGTLALQATT